MLGSGRISPMFRRGGGGWPSPVALGEFIDQDFTALGSLGDYTILNPASAISLTGGYLRTVNNSGLGGFGNYIRFDAHGSSSLRKYTYEWLVIPRDRTATSFGVTAGIISTNANATVSVGGFFGLYTGGGPVQVYINGAAVGSASGNLSYNLGDRIRLIFERDELTYTVTAINTDNGNASVTTSHTVSSSDIGNAVNTVGKPVLYSNGGTQDIEYFTASSDEWKNADLLIEGDSIAYSYSAATLGASYSHSFEASRSTSKIAIHATPGDKTQDVLNTMSELLMLNPKNVLLVIGGNDILFGVAGVTYQANYLSIVNQLVANGTTVYLAYNTPRTATDIRAINTYINSGTFSAYTKIPEFFNDLLDGVYNLAPAYNSGDGTHPNSAGHTVLDGILDTYFNPIIP